MADTATVYTVNEIKEILGVGYNTAYALVNRADFPSIRISKNRIIVPVKQFNDWLEKEAKKTAL